MARNLRHSWFLFCQSEGRLIASEFPWGVEGGNELPSPRLVLGSLAQTHPSIFQIQDKTVPRLADSFRTFT